MTDQSLEQMSEMVDALYQKEQMKIQPLLKVEAELRRKLEQLRARRTEGRASDSMFAMQSCGAEMLWQAWADRTHRDLNLELAKVLAQKADFLDAVRRAYGKKRAVEAMTETARQKLEEREKKQATKSLLEMSLGKAK